MRRFYYAVVGFIIGIVGFPFSFLLPGFKFFYFFIPLFLLCIALRPQEDYFNMNLFIFALIFFLFLGTSNLITFDASTPFNLRAAIEVTTSIIDIISVILLVAPPVLGVLVVIYAFLKGDVGNVIKGVAFVVMFIGFVLTTFALFSLAGIELGGATYFIASFYTSLLDLIVNLPIQAYDGIGDLLEATPFIDFKLPKIPSQYKKSTKGLRFDAVFSTASYSDVIYTIHDALPLVIAIICLFISLITIRPKWERSLERTLEEAQLAPREEISDRKPFRNFSYFIAFYMGFLLLSAFMVFLSYTSTWGENPQDDYRILGYLAIYLPMALFPLVLMITTDLIYFQRTYFVKTLKGIILGTVTLVLINRLFFMERVLDAYSTVNFEASFAYVWNTFSFVAPAETILFQVFFVGLVAQMLRKKNRSKNIITIQGEDIDVIEGSKEEVLQELSMQKQVEFKLIEYYKRNQHTQQERIALVNAQNRLVALDEYETTVQAQESEEVAQFKELFKTPQNVVILILAMVGFNFLFANMHWFLLNQNYGLNFFTFWLSGLGVIYFSGGCWFTFISLRYGWFAGVMTHGAVNTSAIIITILLASV